MAELKNGCPPENAEFKEAVCVDAGRVYDSCCDRDCLEDLRCFFLPEDQALLSGAISVRLHTAEVLNVFIDVEPVNFNKGFYSCDLTFFFLINICQNLSQRYVFGVSVNRDVVKARHAVSGEHRHTLVGLIDLLDNQRGFTP